MIFTKYKFFLFTSHPERLVKFYSETLGFKIISQLNWPKDRGYMVEVSPGYEIWIAYHSKVKAKNQDPYRHILNIYTTEVENLFKKLKAVEGVRVIQSPVSMGKVVPGETRLVATILDPEGNCLQFMEPSK